MNARSLTDLDLRGLTIGTAIGVAFGARVNLYADARQTTLTTLPNIHCLASPRRQLSPGWMIRLPSAGIGLWRCLSAARPEGGEEHGDSHVAI